MGLDSMAAIMSAGGAYQQSQGQRSSIEYQASVSRTNAMFAGGQASDAITAGQAVEGNQRIKTAQLKGIQRAQMAANGVDLGEGNAKDVLTTTKFMGERDALQIHDNAMMQAWGYRTQQQSFLGDAQRQGSAAGAISPWAAAGTSLLTGAGKVAANWDAKAKVNGTPDFGTTVKSKWSSMWGNG